MNQTGRLLLAVLALAGLNGCATVSRESSQHVNIVMQDQQGSAIHGARCRVEHSGGILVGNSPMMRVPVSRSGSPLVVECVKPGAGLARSLAHSKSSGNQLMMLIQPLAGTAIDHMSGRIYDYPATITLVLGQEVVWDARKTEPVSVSQLTSERIPLESNRIPAEP
ncbi:MAG: hypothetical protein ACK5OT_03285 [Burkholderiales bacterium]